MSDDGVVIEHGLPDALRDQAAEVFDEAFGNKMRMVVRDADRRKAFMSRAYVADHALIARRDDQLLGLAGLSTKGGAFAGGLLGGSWDPRPYRDLLGWLGAMWAIWGMRLGDHRPKRDELYLDGIAVAPEARGLGIGTRMLGEIRNTALEHGKRFVRLDVIDSNPRAQALYAREGYKVTKTQSFRYKERWVGFGAMISMELPVLPAADEESPGEEGAGSA